ncbi:MAG: class I SAM-dependent methyltransferase [Candidatus Dojkabacteria bacterium]
MELAKPVPADEKNYIFSEGIDYTKTSSNSIWGKDDKATEEMLRRTVKKGSTWVNLAAGDGRYNTLIASIADKVVDVDIDRGALDKLLRNTPEGYKSKIQLEVFNLVKKFPLESDMYDGVFNSGTLYVFPEDVFIEMASEISRILKVGGYIAIELGVNIKRISPTGEPVVFGDEPLYSREEAIVVMNKAFPGFDLKYSDGDKVQCHIYEANPPYEFFSDILLVEGRKV